MSQVQVLKSAREMVALRPLWEELCCPERTTVFQDFDLNLLAASMFSAREAPYIVCATTSYGAAIIPAVLCNQNGSVVIRLLGEELFDYRNFLYQGDEEVLRRALAALSGLGFPLQITAVRDNDCDSLPPELAREPFSAAPGINQERVSAECFYQTHLRLARNLRRIERLGFELKSYNGENPRLLRTIYQNKAAQDPVSLFRDSLRTEFIVNAAFLQPERFEIFTLERAGELGAALVTLVDSGARRFYTGWFSPELSKHSPSLTLIYEVTGKSLAAGLDCDYMTGEQPYKLRLATSRVPLFRIHAKPQDLARLAEPISPEVRVAG